MKHMANDEGEQIMEVFQEIGIKKAYLLNFLLIGVQLNSETGHIADCSVHLQDHYSAHQKLHSAHFDQDSEEPEQESGHHLEQSHV